MERNTLLKDYITNEIMRNRNAQLSDDQDLINEGIIDSLGILQLVAYIDKTFDIEVPDVDVIYENFYSINAMLRYLQRY